MDHIDMNRLKTGEVNLGVCDTCFVSRSCTHSPSKTSIMAVQFDGGVVIGADSRTTTGSYIVKFTSTERCSQLSLTSIARLLGESCYRQAYARSRSHLLLPLRLSS